MTSISNQIPTHIPHTQLKDTSAQSFNRTTSNQKTADNTSRTFESMLGKPDSQKNTDAQRSHESVKTVMGRSSNSGEEGSKTTNKLSQLLELLQKLAQLMQQLQAKSEAKPAATDTKPAVDVKPETTNQPMPVEPNNGTGAGSPTALPPSSSEIPNTPAEVLDFPADPDDPVSTNQTKPVKLPNISVSDPGRFENEEQPITSTATDVSKEKDTTPGSTGIHAAIGPGSREESRLWTLVGDIRGHEYLGTNIHGQTASEWLDENPDFNRSDVENWVNPSINNGKPAEGVTEKINNEGLGNLSSYTASNSNSNPRQSAKESLTFSSSDEAVIRKHVEPTHRPSTSYHNSVSYNIAITDNDNSGKISSGDTLLLLESTTGNLISESHTLTAQQADEINGDIDQKHALIENKAKWENSGIKDYVMSGTHLPAGDGGRPGVTGLPVEAKPDITVQNGMVVNPDKNSFTVDDIFAALEKNSNAPSAQYNEQYGYPEYANLPNYDESDLGGIKISLLDEFRGEATGTRGDRGFSDSHGASYRIDSFSPLKTSETTTEQSTDNRLEEATKPIDKAGSKESGNEIDNKNQKFFDWFKQNHGDVNNDEEINAADVTAWLKGGQIKPAEPAPKPEFVSFSGKLSDYSLQAGELGSHGRGNAPADASSVLSLKNIQTGETQEVFLGKLKSGEPNVIALKFSDGQFSPNSLIDAFIKQRDNSDIVILKANDIGQFGAYGSPGN